MPHISRKWRLFPVAALLTIAATVGAFAAFNLLSGGAISVGTAPVVACQAAPMVVSYHPVYDSPTATFKIDAVDISNVDPACTGSYDIVVYGAGNATIQEFKGLMSTATSGKLHLLLGAPTVASTISGTTIFVS